MKLSFWVDKSELEKIRNDENLKNLFHRIGFYFGVTPKREGKIHIIVVPRKKRDQIELIGYLKENYGIEAENL